MKPFLSTGLMALAALGGIAGIAYHGGAPALAGQAEGEKQRLRSALENDSGVPSIAPAGYDATIVLFSDYQCPYCRKIHATLEQLRASDRKVRIVYRDFPIFGDVSIEAARTAMAARYQGKHAALNDALLRASGKLTSSGIRQIAQQAGVDWPRLQADMTAHKADIDAALGRTVRYAQMLRLSGTPALIVGDYLIPGAVELDTLQTAVKSARESRKPAG